MLSATLGKRSAVRTAALDAGLVFCAVLTACLLGIATRPAGLLAAIWPANAVLLGLLVRFPHLSKPAGWVAAVAAYLAADLATGATLAKTLLLTAGNLAGVVVGVRLYMRVQENDRRLRRPLAVLRLTLISCAGAATSGLVGAFINPMLFHQAALDGWIFWFVTELVNYVAILPVVLTFRWPIRTHEETDGRLSIGDLGPLAALVLSCAASVWLGGPGAVAFPVPALLWCALVYSVPATAVVTLLFGAWTLVAISVGAIHVGGDFNSVPSMLSIRVGVALIALAPINVACAMAARSEFQALLQRMVTNDPLTAALSRRAFSIRCKSLLAGLAGTGRPAAALVLDVDRLEEINHTHGHAAGDLVLKTLARTARACLPYGDDLGRIGSDEFAVLLSDCQREEAVRLAECIRSTFGDTTIPLSANQTLTATVSIGIVFADRPPRTIEPLLAQADRVLRRAKQTRVNGCASTTAL